MKWKLPAVIVGAFLFSAPPCDAQQPMTPFGFDGGTITNPLTAPSFTSPATGQFFQNNGANIDRFSDRLFVGPGTQNDGIFYSSGCPSCGGSNFSRIDWLALLQNQSYNGGPGILSDGPYAQMYILADPNASIASLATPQVTLDIGIESLNGITGSTPRGLEVSGVNNAVSGHPTLWSNYTECHRVTSGAGQTYCYEVEARNSVANVVWDANYATGYGTIPMELGCGAGLAATGQYPCTTALYVASNPEPFNAGIIFYPGSLTNAAPGSTYGAIELPSAYSVEWLVAQSSAPSTIGAEIHSNSSGNMLINTVADVKLNAAQSLLDLVSTGAFNSQLAFYSSTSTLDGCIAAIHGTGQIGIGPGATCALQLIVNGNGNVTLEGLVGTGSRPVCVIPGGTLEAGSLSAGLTACP